MNYLDSVISGSLYQIAGSILLFFVLMCLVFLVKSYKEGKKLGMDEKV